jgi:CRISPR-associated protein Csb2
MVPNERDMLYELVAKWERERGDPQAYYAVELGTPSEFGRPLRAHFGRVDFPSKQATRSDRWSRASRRFITATPIALDRYPGNLRSNAERAAHRAAAEAERSIADACERIGLPRPASVSISLAPILAGSQHVRQYAPPPTAPGKPARVRVHADILFHEPVRGPVILGAGRFFGLGLCLPVSNNASPSTPEEMS